MTDKIKEQEPVALLLMGIGVKPSIRSTCGCVCVSEEEAEEYTPQCILKLYAAPLNLEAERQKDAALIEQLAGVLQFYMNTGITESLYYKAKEALKVVEEWRKK